MTFPRNAWYVACTPDELADKPLGRQVCGERLVLYRTSEGGPVAALEDFCPHRGAPLSLGRVCEGKLVCGYHGLEMGCEGKTIAMPGQRVRGFPSIRRHRSQRFRVDVDGGPAATEPLLATPFRSFPNRKTRHEDTTSPLDLVDGRRGPCGRGRLRPVGVPDR